MYSFTVFLSISLSSLHLFLCTLTRKFILSASSLVLELSKTYVPYFLDYSVPLFSSRPRIDRALCPGLRVILRALE